MNNQLKTIVVVGGVVIVLLLLFRGCERTKEIELKQRTHDGRTKISLEIKREKDKDEKEKN